MATGHDQAVLNAIFNPYLPLGEGVSFQQDDNKKDESRVFVEKKTERESEATALELEAVRKAEVGLVKQAVELFTSALTLAPDRPSLYNNRAQALRLLGDDDAALSDLDHVVETCGAEGEVAQLALCQRALVHRRRGDNTSATADLRAAAALGSDFAKQQLVQMNPYAAMCNQMLKQMFTKLSQPT